MSLLRKLTMLSIVIALMFNFSNAAAFANTGTFDISVPLALDNTTVTIGDILQATSTYGNDSSSAIGVQDIVITCRPPGGTNADRPYMGFSPRAGAQTIEPGQTIELSASRSFTSEDPTGRYWAYATYQDAAGAWHDGPIVDFTVSSADECVPTTCEAQGANCGSISDSRGSTLSCGSCTEPQTCGGGGQPNVCGDDSNNNPSGEAMPVGDIGMVLREATKTPIPLTHGIRPGIRQSLSGLLSM